MNQIPSRKIKSYFLGPQAENAEIVKKLGNFIFGHWFSWRKKQFPNDGSAITAEDQLSPEFRNELKNIKFHVLDLVARLQREVPSFSPRYIGHMVSEISLPALMGHFITLVHNPNNITGEVARVSIEIEREAIGEVMKMLGFSPELSRGHFTSGGTVANIEGLVRARSRLAKWIAAGILSTENKITQKSLFELAHQGWESFDNLAANFPAEEIRHRHFLHSNPLRVAKTIESVFGIDYNGPIVLAPSSKHYCWPKAIILMGLGANAFWPVDLDKTGGMSVVDLKKKIELARKQNRPILGVVSVAGTTELGDFDPIHEIQQTLDDLILKEGIHIWHHIDAAYGGFFRCIAETPESPLTASTHAALKAIEKADSVTVDPHKLGYVPYASGAFVCKNAHEYYVAPFDAPYLRFDYDSNKMPQTLEGSRSAGGAMSTWLTAKCIGLNSEGYGQILTQTIKQRQNLERKITRAHPLVRVAPHSETNILCFTIAKEGESIAAANNRALKMYEAINHNEKIPFFVSMTSLKWENYGPFLDDYVSSWSAIIDDSKLSLLRLTLMNPFFESDSTEINYSDELIRELLILIEQFSKA
jgi:glutamate/tyrosine decarboxylase-like PLP-dependent enzyme